MTKKIRRKHSDQFKQDAISMVVDNGGKITEIARRLDISPSLLGKWVRNQKSPEPKSDSDEQSYEMMAEELAKLRKEVKELRMEKEILKKATAFFAKESS